MLVEFEMLLFDLRGFYTMIYEDCSSDGPLGPLITSLLDAVLPISNSITNNDSLFISSDFGWWVSTIPSKDLP